MGRSEEPHGIKRHQTAMSRPELSRPIRVALEAGLITPEHTVFDYGCGRGDDMRRLQTRGIPCGGWDPVHYPEGVRCAADVVNLGYVVNVIEEPRERAHVLRDAWSLTRQLLIVAARLTTEAHTATLRRYQDGYLTQRETFQKFFTQQELKAWIEATLHVSSVAAGPGIFFVFRDASQRCTYLVSQCQQRRSRPRPPAGRGLTPDHAHTLLQPLLAFVAARGRLPDATEIDNAAALREAFGGLTRAGARARHLLGEERWAQLRERGANDLLVDLALARFGQRPRFAALPPVLQRDVKGLFGTYARACEAADRLLQSVGDREMIERACREAACGKLTREALYVHQSGLASLPPVLRVYEGCARSYIGSIEGANVIKLHRSTARISYLAYPEFDRDPHPALTSAFVVDLHTLQVRALDYSHAASPPVLHRKEALVPADYPGRAKFARLTRHEERWGLYETPATIGTRNRWHALLQAKGVRLAGHRLLKVAE